MEHTIYLVFAVAGSTLAVLLVVLQVIGFLGIDGAGEVHTDLGGNLGVDHDPGFLHTGDQGAAAGVEGHGNVFFGILSFRALAAFAAVFGLSGLILEGSGLSIGPRVLLAVGAGSAAMLGIARLMLAMTRLSASGTLDIRNAVGHSGVVYTRIPEKHTGWGKVTVEIQGRTLELRAVTSGPELKAGHRCTVVDVSGDDTLEVEGL